MLCVRIYMILCMYCYTLLYRYFSIIIYNYYHYWKNGKTRVIDRDGARDKTRMIDGARAFVWIKELKFIL